MSSPSTRRAGIAALSALALAGTALSTVGSGAASAASDDVLAPLARAEGEVIPGQYIVFLEKGASKAQTERAVDLTEAVGGLVDRTFANLGAYSADLSAAELEEVRNDPGVAFVAEDSVVTVQATQSNATWGIDRIDQRAMPLSGTYTYGATGAGVKSYIIDTGINASHSEFTGRVGKGYSAVLDLQGTNDCNGHGTHVAGTVGGSTYGVAKQTTLVPVKVLNCLGSGSNSGVIAGMDWVASQGGGGVANMSLGGGASEATDAAIARMTASGITTVVAAGNEDQDACNVSPARAPSAITVGATTNTDARASYSNWGSCVDVFAPGSDITSAWIGSSSATNTISGTSMASPHVAGVAAQYLQLNPGSSPAAVTSAIVSNATTGVVSDTKGAPNRLLFTNY